MAGTFKNDGTPNQTAGWVIAGFNFFNTVFNKDSHVLFNLGNIGFSEKYSDIPALRNVLAAGIPGTYNIDSTGVARANGGWYYAFGDFTTFNKGILTINPSGTWSYSGIINGGYDINDYEPKPWGTRTALGEVLTDIAGGITGPSKFYAWMSGSVNQTFGGALQTRGNPYGALSADPAAQYEQAISTFGNPAGMGYTAPTVGAAALPGATLPDILPGSALMPNVPLSNPYGALNADPNLQYAQGVLSFGDPGNSGYAAPTVGVSSDGVSALQTQPGSTQGGTSFFGSPQIDGFVQPGGDGVQMPSLLNVTSIDSPVVTAGQYTVTISDVNVAPVGVVATDPIAASGNGSNMDWTAITTQWDTQSAQLDSLFSSIDWSAGAVTDNSSYSNSYSSYDTASYSGGWGGGGGSSSGPIVLDLSGKGINITPLSSSNNFFDMAGDGYQHRTAWAGSFDRRDRSARTAKRRRVRRRTTGARSCAIMTLRAANAAATRTDASTLPRG